MDIFFVPLLQIVLEALGIYKFFLIVYVIMGWLEAFNIINRYNNVVYMIQNFLFRIIDPVLVHIRRILPPISGIDLSPILLFFAIFFVQSVLTQILMRFAAL